MYLLVLDLSLNCSGYAAFLLGEGRQKTTLLNFGNINNNHFATNEVGKKLNNLEIGLTQLRNAYHPAIVVKEELVRGTMNSSVQVTKAHGIAEKVFSFHTINDINNSTFKFAFTGHGKAEKEDVEAEVMKYEDDLTLKKLGTPKFRFKTDDESDAVGIGIQWLIDNNYIKKKEDVV